MTADTVKAIGYVIPWMLGAALIAWLIYWDYRKKLLEREERRVMIERGMTPHMPDPVGWMGVKARENELKYLERRVRLEKGLDVPLEGPHNALGPLGEVLPKRKPRQREDYLRRGLVSLFIGLALGASYAVVRYGGGPTASEVADWLLALAILSPVAALYGLANVLFYALTKPAPRVTDSARSPAP